LSPKQARTVADTRDVAYFVSALVHATLISSVFFGLDQPGIAVGGFLGVAALGALAAWLTRSRPAPKHAANPVVTERMVIKAPAQPVASAQPVVPAPVAVGPDFPIPGYADLSVARINPLLTDLGLEQLEQVRDAEERGLGRVTVLRRIDRLVNTHLKATTATA
jgi:hypothetical protein